MENDLILSLETATRGGSVAVMRGRKVLASSTGIAEESHSINLLTRIESLLGQAQVALSDIDLFVTATGPGSFTGLRIGLATMKAFAATLKRPCVGVPTLEAIAFAAGSSRRTYALLGAGRGEVFAQLFGGSGNGDGVGGDDYATPANRGLRARDAGEEDYATPENRGLRPLGAGGDARATSALHLPPGVLLAQLDGASSLVWAGPGAHLYKDLIRQRATELGIGFVEEMHASSGSPQTAYAEISNDIHWALAPNVEQLAEYVAILALERANDYEQYRPEDLRAIYVRPSDAELAKGSIL